MKQYIAHITLVVNDYDEAIEFYTKKLKFTLLEDTILSETKDGFWLRRPVQKNVVNFWQRLQMMSSIAESATKQADEFSCFYILIILNVIIKIYWIRI